jgi:PqqD family protein of HPr-rel-A system
MPKPISQLAISETGFVFDPRTGATFNVNGTGLVVLTALREGADPLTIARTLGGRFQATPADVKEHVTDFVRTLRQLGLVNDEVGATTVGDAPAGRAAVAPPPPPQAARPSRSVSGAPARSPRSR